MAGVPQELEALIGTAVEGLGYELVDVERAGPMLRVALDVPGGARGVTIEDCERVSHHLTHLFAVESVSYDRLEVGSPGVDRPLKRARDFARFVGSEVKVQLLAPLDGRKRLRGRVVAVDGAAGAERIALDLIEGTAQPDVRRVARPAKPARKKIEAPVRRVEFALADMDKARLVPELDFRSGRS